MIGTFLLAIALRLQRGGTRLCTNVANASDYCAQAKEFILFIWHDMTSHYGFVDWRRLLRWSWPCWRCGIQGAAPGGAHLVTCCTHWTGTYCTMVCTGYRTHSAKQMNRSKAWKIFLHSHLNCDVTITLSFALAIPLGVAAGAQCWRGAYLAPVLKVLA